MINSAKRVLLPLSVALLICPPLFAQRLTPKKLITISGTIGAEGTTFLSDEDQEVWRVSNPAALRHLEGRHARLKFLITTGNEDVFVTSVKLIEEQTTAFNHRDSAVRR